MVRSQGTEMERGRGKEIRLFKIYKITKKF
jgi:hypothetical protein